MAINYSPYYYSNTSTFGFLKLHNIYNVEIEKQDYLAGAKMSKPYLACHSRNSRSCDVSRTGWCYFKSMLIKMRYFCI